MPSFSHSKPISTMLTFLFIILCVLAVATTSTVLFIRYQYIWSNEYTIFIDPDPKADVNTVIRKHGRVIWQGYINDIERVIYNDLNKEQ